MAEAFLTGQSGKKLVGNAAVGDVLSGKTFSNAGSNKLTGTMPNKGKVDYQMPVNGSFTIPAGYHNGTGIVFQNINAIPSETITPGTSPTTILGGRYLTGNIVVEGDADLVPANIRAGANIFGVAGNTSIIDTTGGTAVAADILINKTAFVNGMKITGGMDGSGLLTLIKTVDGSDSELDADTVDGIHASGFVPVAHLEDDTNPHSTNKTHVGLSNVDNVKQMPIAGGTFTGVAKAQTNTSYTTAQLRNVILSTANASVASMGNGDIWIKYV